jgi:hypothetical protein
MNMRRMVIISVLLIRSGVPRRVPIDPKALKDVNQRKDTSGNDQRNSSVGVKR